MADKTSNTASEEAAAAGTDSKSRFDAALDDAKNRATAYGEKGSELSAEAREKAGEYAVEAKEKASELAVEAKVKAGELAVDGKAKATEAMTGLSKIVGDNVTAIDEKFGPKYGDYARKASTALSDTAEKLEAKSIEDLGDDAKQFVKDKPGTALGIAAVAGFLIARMFRSK